MTLDNAFKDYFANWPSGVAAVTCIGTDGKPQGFTASSVISVSMDPPLVLFALKRDANSLPHFLAAKAFAVNALSREQQDVSTLFSTRSADRFGNVRHRPGPATGAPLLEGAWGTLECKMHAQYDGGDHVLFLGRIVAIETDGGEPLVYHRRGYRRVVDDGDSD